MSYSPLVDKYIPADPSNYSRGRAGNKIDKITWHHMAGNLSIETCGKLWQKKGRNASSNYGIGTDGRIACYVDDENRSWCSSSAANDNRAITIEIANDGGAPDWHVSDAAVKAAIKLTIDLCKRYGITKINYTGDANGNFTEHRYFTATLCPGPYLHNNMANNAKKINAGLPAPAPTPTPTPTPGDGFLPKKGYWCRYDKDNRVSQLATFMRKTFPSYTPAAALGPVYGDNLWKSIKEFQRRAKAAGRYNDAIDGDTGPKTYAALKSYGFRYKK